MKLDYPQRSECCYMNTGNNVKPLVERVYRYKEPLRASIALFVVQKEASFTIFRLTKGNFQILLITIVINICVFPLTGAKVFFFFPV